MKLNFDYYHNLEDVELSLCNPDGRELFPILGVNRNLTLRFNDLSKLTFDIYPTITKSDGSVLNVEVYDYVCTKRLVYATNVGWFQIVSVDEPDDGIVKYKSVVAESLQTIFKNRGFYTEERVYCMYNEEDPTDEYYSSDDPSAIPSVVGQLNKQLGIEINIQLSNVEPDKEYERWTITYISKSLQSLHRTFKENTTYGYDWMVNDVEDAFEAVVLFDILYKSIQILSPDEYVEKTNVLYSFSNFMQNINVSENSEDIVTVLNCSGDNCGIASVNPTGTSYLCDFSYYMDETTDKDGNFRGRWMSAELIQKIKEWKSECEEKQDEYQTLIERLRYLYRQRTSKQTELQELSISLQDLKNAQNKRAVVSGAGSPGDLCGVVVVEDIGLNERSVLGEKSYMHTVKEITVESQKADFVESNGYSYSENKMIYTPPSSEDVNGEIFYAILESAYAEKTKCKDVLSIKVVNDGKSIEIMSLQDGLSVSDITSLQFNYRLIHFVEGDSQITAHQNAPRYNKEDATWSFYDEGKTGTLNEIVKANFADNNTDGTYWYFFDEDSHKSYCKLKSKAVVNKATKEVNYECDGFSRYIAYSYPDKDGKYTDDLQTWINRKEKLVAGLRRNLYDPPVQIRTSETIEIGFRPEEVETQDTYTAPTFVDEIYSADVVGSSVSGFEYTLSISGNEITIITTRSPEYYKYGSIRIKYTCTLVECEYAIGDNSIEWRIDKIEQELQNIADSLNLLKYLKDCPDLLRELECYWIEGDYVNENISVLEDTTPEEEVERSKELMEAGFLELSKVCQPRFSFSIESVDAMQIYEFREQMRSLELGKVITIEKEEGVWYTPALLEISINLDVHDKFNLTFANALKLDDWGYTYADLISSASATSRQVNANWQKILSYSKDRENIDSLIKNPLDSTLRAASANAINQEFVVDNTGILGRKKTSETSDEFEEEQMRMINNCLLFTDDGWETVKTALGKIHYEDDEGHKTSYGLIAETIVGSLIMGDNLEIRNKGSTVQVNEKGILIKKTITGESGEITYEDMFNASALDGSLTIRSANIVDGTLSVGKDEDGSYKFTVGEDGGVTIKSGTIQLGKNGQEEYNFTVNEDGVVTITSGTIQLGKNDQGEYNFTVNEDGSISIKKGTINLGEGNFTVNEDGVVTIKSGIINLGKNSQNVLSADEDGVTIGNNNFVFDTKNSIAYLSNVAITNGSLNIGQVEDSDGSVVGYNFTVNEDGTFYAANANIAGSFSTAFEHGYGIVIDHTNIFFKSGESTLAHLTYYTVPEVLSGVNNWGLFCDGTLQTKGLYLAGSLNMPSGYDIYVGGHRALYSGQIKVQTETMTVKYLRFHNGILVGISNSEYTNVPNYSGT